MTIAEEKTALRAQILAARDTVSPEARAQKSATICHELIEMSQGSGTLTHPNKPVQRTHAQRRSPLLPLRPSSPFTAR